MRRTTIVLPDRLHDALREEAFRARVSMAHLIRQKLGARTKIKTTRGQTRDPLLEVAGIGSDGRLAEGIDAALYGE